MSGGAQDTVYAAPGDSSARGAATATRSSDTLGVPRAPGRIDCARPPLARRTSCRRERKRRRHRQARAVQRSEGQHDDLACFPSTRSRESGHRGAAAAWHGSGAPRRHARRVVSAAPDARTSFGGWLATALKRGAARLILFDLEIYRRLLTAVTLNLVLNGLSFIERCQSGTLDGTDVYEHIFSTSLRLNEPVAFGRIEPLHSAGSHAGLLLNRTATE